MVNIILKSALSMHTCWNDYRHSQSQLAHLIAFIWLDSIIVRVCSIIRYGSRGGGVQRVQLHPPLFFFLLIIIHIIHCYTHYFNLQAGLKIVIITIVNIITFITNTCTHAN